jgi:hypothetical protein
VLRLLETDQNVPFLTPPRRGRIVLELSFADRCDIDARLLLAFLFEAGPHAEVRRAAKQDDLPEWVEQYKILSTYLRAKPSRPSEAPASENDAGS